MNYLEQISASLGRLLNKDTSGMSESELAQAAEDAANGVVATPTQDSEVSLADIDALNARLDELEVRVDSVNAILDTVQGQLGDEGILSIILTHVKTLTTNVNRMKVASPTNEVKAEKSPTIQKLVTETEAKTETLEKGVLNVNLNDFLKIK
jgi:tetrahydromethanopterin S-methyltransferase subunit G